MTDGKVTDNGGDVHTPGPWIIDLASDEIHDTKGNPIATTWCHAGCGWQTKAANARLIAAAPDLLEALRGAIGALEFSQDFHRDLGNEEQAFAADKLDAALKAIAKATGQ